MLRSLQPRGLETRPKDLLVHDRRECTRRDLNPHTLRYRNLKEPEGSSEAAIDRECRETRPGRAARHIVFYRVSSAGVVQVVRFLHDSMDFDRHLP